MPIQIDKHINLALDRVNVQRLVQEVHGTAFVALKGIVHLTACGTDEHDRDVFGFVSATHQLSQFEAIHARHLDIKDGNGELVLQQQRQGLVGRQGFIDSAILALDQRFERQ